MELRAQVLPAERKPSGSSQVFQCKKIKETQFGEETTKGRRKVHGKRSKHCAGHQVRGERHEVQVLIDVLDGAPQPETSQQLAAVPDLETQAEEAAGEISGDGSKGLRWNKANIWFLRHVLPEGERLLRLRRDIEGQVPDKHVLSMN